MSNLSLTYRSGRHEDVLGNKDSTGMHRLECYFDSLGFIVSRLLLIHWKSPFEVCLGLYGAEHFFAVFGCLEVNDNILKLPSLGKDSKFRLKRIRKRFSEDWCD